MTTRDINEVFKIRTSIPSRYLHSDKEILEYIEFCIGIMKIISERKELDDGEEG